MSFAESQIMVKLERVLERLRQNTQHTPSIYTEVEDDTLFHKLHTQIHHHITNTKKGPDWARSVGLMTFIQTYLEPSVVTSTKSPEVVALALKILASLITAEENFVVYTEDKVLCHFLVILPNIRSDPTLFSAALMLVQAILKHKAGAYWLSKNGVWEKMLLPSLRSSSIFVQREGVTVITAFILSLTDTEHFSMLIKDLYLISDKLCELRQHLDESKREELRQSNLCVLRVFRQMYLQTLGKEALQAQFGSIGEVAPRLLILLNHNITSSSVTLVAEVLLLSIIHKFQEKVMEYGLVEQFFLDGLCADTLALTRRLTTQGHLDSFLRSVANLQRYWSIMVQNLKETKHIDLTSEETLLHVVTTLQLTPLVVQYKSCLGQIEYQCPEKAQAMGNWEKEIHSRINLKEEVKVDVRKLEGELMAMLEKDLDQALKIATITISSITADTNHLNQRCAVTVFQGLVLLLGTTHVPNSPIRQYTPLQRAVIEGVRLLVEKFNIDWRKCFASVCLMGMLCDMVKIQGISTQVKVSVLKAMKSCVSGFIPPVMSMLVNSEKLEHNSVEMMGQAMTIYLADLEWEVRDSALDVLITCMQLAKEKYPYFVEWLLRYQLDRAVVVALGDVEGYVRASAFNVLANVISIHKVWMGVEKENLAHLALWSVMMDGESPVRAAAINLVHQLFLSAKYSDEEVDCLVVRVMQRATDDTDDEVRLAALEFIRTHILWKLNRNGMVDGEFPSVTFSRGKITKLDKQEVKKRVQNVLTWVCECGYLCSLLACRKDLVTAVTDKAREIFCFLFDLVTRYEITSEGSKRSTVPSSPLWRDGVRDREDGGQVVVMAGESGDTSKVKEAGDTKGDFMVREDEIDRTISDILAASSLHTVNKIKRPADNGMGSGSPPKSLLLTLDDVPLPNTALPLTSLLTTVDQLCCFNSTCDVEQQRVTDFISLLDDILLEGSGTQHPRHLDDQHLRDCY
ncbi:hypothetical protein Pcinc_027312 [Petrolisthes cinctipes]|uniref:Uncharacterized protein n=1 Tax=Petrolisthes cinctipes TaxID=88211 RepID=A0AAE1F4A5_PETCI|nr:hypothetical protein Pcinc_027312 [Petrolisthes cinctipes]